MTLRYLLKQSRPRFWLYLAGPAAVGLVYGASELSTLVSATAALLVAYFLVPANVFLYGVNDVFDREIDAENPKKADKEVRYRGNTATIVAVLLAGLAGVALLAVVPRAAAPWIAGFLALGAGYSVPPIRFKARPGLDSLSNGLYVLPGIAGYAALAGSMPPLLAIGGGWTWSMAMHTFSAIPDIDADRTAGIRTTATVLGERGARWYCIALWAFAALAFALLDWRAGLLLAIYPLLAAGLGRVDMDIETAYWYYPAINAAVGALLTMAGLWRMTNGL